MVFSLFGRRPKPDPAKARGFSPSRLSDATLRGPSTGLSDEQHREAARKTAEKIDRIESEMMPVAEPGDGSSTTRTADAAAGAGSTPGARLMHASPALEPRSVQPPLAPLEFSTSMVLGDRAGSGAIQVSDANLPADLEEAAILFSNGQSPAALTTLKAALARGDLADNARLAWSMLFDVLQASGLRAEFDALGLDYAARFETSPPAWLESPAAAPAGPARRTGSTVVVTFGPRLDVTAQRQLEQVQKAGLQKRPVVADFSRVVAADEAGAGLIARLLDTFARANRELAVQGVDALFAAARATIETGRRDENTGGWLLALAALRLQGRQQEFEDLSIDYCVTYEVSPPSWEPPAPKITLVAAEPQITEVGGHPTTTDGSPVGAVIEGDALVLRGQLIGRMVGELGLLRTYAAERTDVVIDARALQRLDFVAAGELLNEVVILRGAAKSVLFIQPSFIVEALMVVMGIHELAEIRRRPL